MKKYVHETMYILRPDISEDVVTNLTTKFETLLRDTGATEIQVQNQGKKRLAQTIRKQRDGIYILMNYQCDGSQIAVLERSMRITEEVIRYMTLKLEIKEKRAKAASNDKPISD